jgi:hypothetical protein
MGDSSVIGGKSAGGGTRRTHRPKWPSHKPWFAAIRNAEALWEMAFRLWEPDYLNDAAPGSPLSGCHSRAVNCYSPVLQPGALPTRCVGMFGSTSVPGVCSFRESRQRDPSNAKRVILARLPGPTPGPRPILGTLPQTAANGVGMDLGDCLVNGRDAPPMAIVAAAPLPQAVGPAARRRPVFEAPPQERRGLALPPRQGTPGHDLFRVVSIAETSAPA